VEELDLKKEQRRELLKWVFYGVGAMLFIVCGSYVQARVEQRVLHAYGLTVLCYGANSQGYLRWRRDSRTLQPRPPNPITSIPK